MKEQDLRRAGLIALALLSLFTLIPKHSSAHATRDHLTQQEADLVRDEQVLDKRTAIFIKACERRLALLVNPNTASTVPAKEKDKDKDADKWGPPPKGTRAELLSDIAKILDEAIDNIDDVSARDESNPLVPKALRQLAQASTRFLAQLTPMQAQATEQAERDALNRAIENAQMVIEAAEKLPPAAEMKGKKKS